jgi:hypothetical protein
MMELDRILSLPEFKFKVAFVTKDGADIELMKFEDPSIPIGVRHICAQVPDDPKAAQELSRQGVGVVRRLGQRCRTVAWPGNGAIGDVQRPHGSHTARACQPGEWKTDNTLIRPV